MISFLLSFLSFSISPFAHVSDDEGWRWLQNKCPVANLKVQVFLHDSVNRTFAREALRLADAVLLRLVAVRLRFDISETTLHYKTRDLFKVLEEFNRYTESIQNGDFEITALITNRSSIDGRAGIANKGRQLGAHRALIANAFGGSTVDAANVFIHELIHTLGGEHADEENHIDADTAFMHTYHAFDLRDTHLSGVNRKIVHNVLIFVFKLNSNCEFQVRPFIQGPRSEFFDWAIPKTGILRLCFQLSDEAREYICPKGQTLSPAQQLCESGTRSQVDVTHLNITYHTCQGISNSPPSVPLAEPVYKEINHRTQLTHCPPGASFIPSSECFVEPNGEVIMKLHDGDVTVSKTPTLPGPPLPSRVEPVNLFGDDYQLPCIPNNRIDRYWSWDGNKWNVHDSTGAAKTPKGNPPCNMSSSEKRSFGFYHQTGAIYRQDVKEYVHMGYHRRLLVEDGVPCVPSESLSKSWMIHKRKWYISNGDSWLEKPKGPCSMGNQLSSDETIYYMADHRILGANRVMILGFFPPTWREQKSPLLRKLCLEINLYISYWYRKGKWLFYSRRNGRKGNWLPMSQPPCWKIPDGGENESFWIFRGEVWQRIKQPSDGSRRRWQIMFPQPEPESHRKKRGVVGIECQTRDQTREWLYNDDGRREWYSRKADGNSTWIPQTTPPCWDIPTGQENESFKILPHAVVYKKAKSLPHIAWQSEWCEVLGDSKWTFNYKNAEPPVIFRVFRFPNEWEYIDHPPKVGPCWNDNRNISGEVYVTISFRGDVVAKNSDYEVIEKFLLKP